MKTNPLTYLAAIMVGGAVLAGGKISAQIHDNEFSARPLPPLPTTSLVQHHSNGVHTKTQTVGSVVGRKQLRTLFTIESPPVPPGYDASARIVRPTSAEPATDETTAATAVAQSAPAELIRSSEFRVQVQSQENLNQPPADNTVRVAELPQQLDAQNENMPEAFFVAFQNLGPKGDLEPLLDAPATDAPVTDAPATGSPATDRDAAQLSQSTSDEISIDPDSFRELETDVAENAQGEDDTSNIRGAAEDIEQEPDDLADLDDQQEEDDDDLQPEPRQFGVWPKKSMQELSADVRDFHGKVPADESGALIASTQRFYRGTAKTEKVFAWAAPKIRYQPLYFEDVQLERYGQTKGLVKQPLVSGFKFFRDAALLPVNASIDCPRSCDGPLGFCRPGSPCGDSGCSSCQR